MYYLISSFLYCLVKIFRMLKIEGQEHLPPHQKYVVTCTHKGWIDVIMLALAVYPTQVHFMAKKELFESRLTDRFFRSIHAFPVNRENPGPSTIKIPLKLLKQGKCIGIFPGGTRTSEQIPLKKGAVTIAIKGEAPLIPAVYHGPTNFSDVLRGKKAYILFGKPILTAKDEMKNEKIIEQKLEELDESIKALDAYKYGNDQPTVAP